MSKRATIRKRCAECRRWFTPPARLAKQQRVCSAACRLKRRAKQARARRACEPARYRDEERERQRRCRQEQRLARLGAAKAQKPDAGSEPAGAGGAACHAPGDAQKSRKSQREFEDLWDRLIGVSRAGLEREVRKIARQAWRKSRHAPAYGAVGHGPGGFSIP